MMSGENRTENSDSNLKVRNGYDTIIGGAGSDTTSGAGGANQILWDGKFSRSNADALGTKQTQQGTQENVKFNGNSAVFSTLTVGRSLCERLAEPSPLSWHERVRLSLTKFSGAIMPTVAFFDDSLREGNSKCR